MVLHETVITYSYCISEVSFIPQILKMYYLQIRYNLLILKQISQFVSLVHHYNSVLLPYFAQT